LELFCNSWSAGILGERLYNYAGVLPHQDNHLLPLPLPPGPHHSTAIIGAQSTTAPHSSQPNRRPTSTSRPRRTSRPCGCATAGTGVLADPLHHSLCRRGRHRRLRRRHRRCRARRRARPSAHPPPPVALFAGGLRSPPPPKNAAATISRLMARRPQPSRGCLCHCCPPRAAGASAADATCRRVGACGNAACHPRRRWRSAVNRASVCRLR